MNSVPDDALSIVEERVYQDAIDNAASTVPPGQLRARRYKDEMGHMVTEYHGDPKAWMAPFMGPGVVACIKRPGGQS